MQKKIKSASKNNRYFSQTKAEDQQQKISKNKPNKNQFLPRRQGNYQNQVSLSQSDQEYFKPITSLPYKNTVTSSKINSLIQFQAQIQIQKFLADKKKKTKQPSYNQTKIQNTMQPFSYIQANSNKHLKSNNTGCTQSIYTKNTRQFQYKNQHKSPETNNLKQEQKKSILFSYQEERKSYQKQQTQTKLYYRTVQKYIQAQQETKIKRSVQITNSNIGNQILKQLKTHDQTNFNTLPNQTIQNNSLNIVQSANNQSNQPIRNDQLNYRNPEHLSNQTFQSMSLYNNRNANGLLNRTIQQMSFYHHNQSAANLSNQLLYHNQSAANLSSQSLQQMSLNHNERSNNQIIQALVDLSHETDNNQSNISYRNSQINLNQSDYSLPNQLVQNFQPHLNQNHYDLLNITFQRTSSSPNTNGNSVINNPLIRPQTHNNQLNSAQVITNQIISPQSVNQQGPNQRVNSQLNRLPIDVRIQQQKPAKNIQLIRPAQNNNQEDKTGQIEDPIFQKICKEKKAIQAYNKEVRRVIQLNQFVQKNMDDMYKKMMFPSPEEMKMIPIKQRIQNAVNYLSYFYNEQPITQSQRIQYLSNNNFTISLSYLMDRSGHPQIKLFAKSLQEAFAQRNNDIQELIQIQNHRRQRRADQSNRLNISISPNQLFFNPQTRIYGLYPYQYTVNNNIKTININPNALPQNNRIGQNFYNNSVLNNTQINYLNQNQSRKNQNLFNKNPQYQNQIRYIHARQSVPKKKIFPLNDSCIYHCFEEPYALNQSQLFNPIQLEKVREVKQRNNQLLMAILQIKIKIQSKMPKSMRFNRCKQMALNQTSSKIMEISSSIKKKIDIIKSKDKYYQQLQQPECIDLELYFSNVKQKEENQNLQQSQRKLVADKKSAQIKKETTEILGLIEQAVPELQKQIEIFSISLLQQIKFNQQQTRIKQSFVFN